MTTNKPEIVAYVDMLRGQERRYATLRGDVDQNSLNDGDALIRLSDYEAMQAENALLRASIRRLCNIYVVDDYYDGQMREERLEATVNWAIEQVKETHK